MKKFSAIVGIPLIGVLVLVGCGSAKEEYQAICMDPVTQIRLDDDACDEDDDDGYLGYPWVFLRKGSNIPQIGRQMPKGSYVNSVPKNGRANYNDFPATGGVYSSSNSKPTSKPSTKPSAKSTPKININKPAPKSSGGSSGRAGR